MPEMISRFRRWKNALFILIVALVMACGATGCCWSFVGVVYMGSAAKIRPAASEVAGSYRVRQYGGSSAKAKWPTDLVLDLHNDGTITCTGDHSLFVKDFGVAEEKIDPSHFGRWEFSTGRKGFPVGVEVTIGGVSIATDLLQSGKRYGLGISEAWHGDPDDRNTLEFLQDPLPKP